jgi:hypothetical protein
LEHLKDITICKRKRSKLKIHCKEISATKLILKYIWYIR